MPTPFRDGEKPAICFAMTAFLKMHGLGNDFIVLDARDPANGIPDVIGAAVATRLADRHFGIGCDQILVIRASAKAAKVSSSRLGRSFSVSLGDGKLITTFSPSISTETSPS